MKRRCQTINKSVTFIQEVSVKVGFPRQRICWKSVKTYQHVLFFQKWSKPQEKTLIKTDIYRRIPTSLSTTNVFFQDLRIKSWQGKVIITDIGCYISTAASLHSKHYHTKNFSAFWLDINWNKSKNSTKKGVLARKPLIMKSLFALEWTPDSWGMVILIKKCIKFAWMIPGIIWVWLARCREGRFVKLC